MREYGDLPAISSAEVGGKSAYLISREEMEAVAEDRANRNNSNPVKPLGPGAMYVWSGGQQRAWKGAGDGEFDVQDTGVAKVSLVDNVRDNKMIIVGVALFVLVVLVIIAIVAR